MHKKYFFVGTIITTMLLQFSVAARDNCVVTNETVFKNTSHGVLLSKICSCKMPVAHAQEGVLHRKAELKDVESISKLYDAMSEQDRKSLVVIPHSLRHEWLTNHIQQGAFYVAERDTEIVGFVKVFVLSDQYELNNVLYQELNCCGEKRELQASKCYNVPLLDVGKFKPLPHEKIDKDFELRLPGQTFIYYGSSYVVPHERGTGVGTELKNFAFKYIFHDVMRHVHENKSTEIVLLYGQVPLNIKHESMVRSFLLLLSSIFIHLDLFFRFQKEPYFQLYYHTYRSHKPILQKNESGNLEEKYVARDQWQDYGCVITCSLG